MNSLGRYIDLTGMRFGKLSVIERAEDYVSPRGYRGVAWKCRCDCGKDVVIRGCNLRNGKSLSCGCNRIEHPNRLTHGQKGTRLYAIWKSMKGRCYNKNNNSYRDYGGRGITVCDEWRENFENFRDWAITHGYAETLSIDRIDNNCGYSPRNCRWVDWYTQANNTRHNHLVSHNGQTLTLSEWSKSTGVPYHRLKDRINKLGWDIERALTE